MSFDFWKDVVSLRFLLMFGLVLAGFLPMLWSIRATWLAARAQEEDE